MDIDTSRIDLENGKILYQGTWLTADDLKEKIQEKMTSGDMKFAALASLLEELNTALEYSQILETKVILSKEQYEKLDLLSGGKINELVRQAILEFIEDPGADRDAAPDVEFVVKNETGTEETAIDTAGKKGKTAVIKCSKCGSPIEIDTENMPSEIRCSSCNARGMLKTHKNKPRFSNHFAG